MFGFENVVSLVSFKENSIFQRLGSIRNVAVLCVFCRNRTGAGGFCCDLVVFQKETQNNSAFWAVLWVDVALCSGEHWFP